MFLADESVDFGIITLLRKSGYSVRSIAEEMPSISDKAVLEESLSANLVVITEDKDFGELVHRLRLSHCGILLIRLSELPREERIQLAYEYIKLYEDKMRNSFCVLSKNGLRVNSGL